MFLNDKKALEAKNALIRALNFEKELYGKSENKANIAMNIVENVINIELNDLQKNYLKELFSRMDVVTLTHSLETAALADNYIYLYEQKTKNDFSKKFDIDKNDFKLALLIHDTGKIVTDKDLILSNKVFTEDERQRMRNHSLKSIETIKQINEIANPNISIDKIFSTKVTDIAQYHHPDYTECKYQRMALPTFTKLASIIDITEAMTSSNRYYRNPSATSEIVDIINRNLDNCCIERQKETLSFITSEENLGKLLQISEDERDYINTSFSRMLTKEIKKTEVFNNNLEQNNSKSYELRY